VSTDVVRVASVPANHVYVRHLAPVDGSGGVIRLPDPPVAGRAVASRWWPPVMLESAWVADHLDDFDPRPHSDLLDVLIPAADAVVTLTPGAAQQIEHRWGRSAVVLAHPHVVPLPRIARRRPHSLGRFVVGLHAKSLRASMDPLAVLRVLTAKLRELADCELRVDVHTDVMNPHGANHDSELARFLHAAEAAGDLSLHVHDYFSDDELWAYLAGLDVSVLPYRFGTHSGWLEACHDLGTTVIAPSCGFYAEQRPCLTYGHDESHIDAESLVDAAIQVYEQRPIWQADRQDRIKERQTLGDAHGRLYAGLLANRTNVLTPQ
jgi:hypothetical protein